MDDRKAAWEERQGRRELRSIARELTALCYRLQGLLASVPPRDDEVTIEDSTGSGDDTRTGMRVAVQCVLRDNLEPAIASLRAVSRKPGGRE